MNASGSSFRPSDFPVRAGRFPITLPLRWCCFLPVLLVCFTLPAHAEIIGVEQFDYRDGPILNKNGGTFWDFGNIATPAAPVHDGTPSLWQNISGAPAVASGRLVTNGNSALRPHNGPSLGFGTGSDEEKGSVTDGNRVHQVVYHRVTFTTGATVPDFLGLSTYDFGTERIFFGKGFGKSVFGIETTNGFGAVNSTTAAAIQVNTPYTLVAKVDYVNDRLSLWINPTFGGTEPTTADAVINGYTSNNFSTGVRLASGSGSAVTWDNLLSATTWAEIGGTVVTTAADEDNPLLGGSGTGVSLREAVKYSPSGTLITFDPSLNGKTCTLSLGQMVVVDRNLTIDASSLANGFTVDGNDASRIFSLVNKALTLKSLTLTKGHPASGGGAIDQDNGSQLFVQNCTLSENSAVSGGAFQQTGPDATSRFENCTIVGNRAMVVNSTGGLRISQGTCTLVNCTISGNIGRGLGGGLFLQSDGASVSLSNCIVAGNSDSAANDIFLSSGDNNTLTASDTNLIGSNATVSGTFTQGPLVGTQSTPLDPKLSPLGYFGGPTQTMHPLIGSPAIDAGGTTNPGGTDQRGFPRFVDGDGSTTAQLDIGAVEAGPLFTVSFNSDVVVGGGQLRDRITSAVGFAGGRIGFSPTNFPSQSITLNGTELTIPATANGLFIDASNLSGPVTISGNPTTPSRVFNITAGATVAMHSLRIVNGKALNGGGQAGSGQDGGGVLNDGSLSLFSCTVTNNRSGNGSDGFSVFPGNGGNGGFGGGIDNRGRLNLTACNVSGNATGDGGDNGSGGPGGGISSTGPLSLTACTLANNVTGKAGNAASGSGGSGGAISSSGPLQLTACTLSGNATGNGGNGDFFGGRGGDGGGIRKNDDTPYRLIACTLVGNRTGSGGTGGNGLFGNGGGVSNGNLILQNSIVANNTRNGTPIDVNVNSITYLGANLLGTAAFSSTTGIPTFINADSQLAPLGDYGGPTQTMPPLPGSPAIDAATANTAQTDQRGFPRSRDGDGNGTATPDIGAVEASVIAVTTMADTNPGSLRQAVLEAAAQPGADTVYFTSAVTGPITLASQILLTDPSPVTIDATTRAGGVTVSGGTTTRHFQVPTGQNLTLRGLTLTGGNGSGGDGGSIFNAGTLALDRCTLTGNTSSFNGGAVAATGSFTAMDSTFSNNTAGGDGGGIYAYRGTTTLTRCTIASNTATLRGGIFSDTSATSGPITSSTTLTHCTLAGNSSSQGGGGFFNQNGRTTLTHCTLSGNTSPAGKGTGAASYGDNDTETVVKNTLISGNSGSSVDFVGNGATLNSFTSQGGNLIGSGNATGDFNQPGDVLSDTPKLTPLGYFGGPVQTMHPLIGSPAIDSAGTTDPGGTDARGFPRFVDGDTASAGVQLDIGAVEAGPLRTVAVSLDNIGPLRLRGEISAGANTPGTRIGFNPANFPAPTITLSLGQIDIPATASIFIDASNLSGPVTISGNNASRVFNIPASATVAMHSLRIVGGATFNGSGNGGGILNAGACTLMSSTLDDNDAFLSGGGIYNTGFCAVISSTLSENQANGGNGGGIFNSGTCTVISSTLGQNQATGGGANNGGGIFNSGICTVTSSTVSGNGADLEGGGIANHVGSTTFQLTSSIVAGNTASLVPNVAGPISGTNNLTSGEPLLAPLGDYGGPTRTMALRPGSPARNAGSTTARRIDQRGFPLVGLPDIGAYEAGNALLTNYNAFIQETLPATATLAETAPAFDFDGDGQTNEAEWLAVTGPGNPASAFRPEASRDGTALIISFPTGTGRTYTLERSDDLAPGSWTTTALPAPVTLLGTGSTRQFTVPTATPIRRYFRVRITQ